MRRLGLKRTILILWACALAFGLSFEVARAAALDGLCGSECSRACGASGCALATSGPGPCECSWICDNGDEGSSTCL